MSTKFEDDSSLGVAKRQAATIALYYRKRGQKGVSIWVEPVLPASSTEAPAIWGVRSNLSFDWRQAFDALRYR